MKYQHRIVVDREIMPDLYMYRVGNPLEQYHEDYSEVKLAMLPHWF